MGGHLRRRQALAAAFFGKRPGARRHFAEATSNHVAEINVCNFANGADGVLTIFFPCIETHITLAGLDFARPVSQGPEADRVILQY